MAAACAPVRRRRSHSLSTASPLPAHSLECPSKVASKRSHSQHSTDFSPPSSQLWDADIWRREKRRRKDFYDYCTVRDHSHVYTLSTPDTLHESISTRPQLASTSDEFNLYPSTKRKTRFHRQPTLREVPVEELQRLRWDAFKKLEESVARGEEKFYTRMLDYERSISGAGRGRRGEAPLSVWYQAETASEDGDTEDDFEIIAEPPRSSLSIHTDESMLDVTNEESPNLSPSHNHFHSTNGPSTNQAPISYQIPSPTLTAAQTESEGSSLYPTPMSSSPIEPFPPHDGAPPPTASSDQTIDALTLALANGAGGLNDYHDLRALEEKSLLNGCDVGELWR
ncbi:hypothetical protein AX16_009640 [Volvariella volvacea WC 439]|nr:hypothetical protein AX16_009640 [Volvariella volvacea WC 439]